VLIAGIGRAYATSTLDARLRRGAR
jgi:hypothetical protein